MKNEAIRRYKGKSRSDKAKKIMLPVSFYVWIRFRCATSSGGCRWD